MKKYNKYIGLFLLSLGLFSCDNEEVYSPIEGEVIPTVALKADGVDFSKYVSIGASFTSGFTDGALFIAAQENSFPNILASKFAMANGGTFTQPLMNDNIGGFAVGSTVVQPPRFFFNASSGGPARLNAVPTTNPLSPLGGGAYNNYGIPGAKSFHLTFSGYGTLNPYFGRMMSNPGASVLGDAAAQMPTFFTLSEVGGNDVLGFALSGGFNPEVINPMTGVVVRPASNAIYQSDNMVNPASYGTNDVTNADVFAQVFSGMITALTANGTTKGVVGNLPNITSLSNFTTVPYNAIPLDQATADQLNAGFAAYNDGLQNLLNAFNAGLLPANLMGYLTQVGFNQEEVDKRQVSYSGGQNAVLLLDENLIDLSIVNPALTNMRQATSADLLPLAASSFLGTTVGGNPSLINGVSVPLADQWVLTPEEQAVIATATAAYNSTISAVVDANPNVALVDLNSILVQASTTGIMFDQYNMNTGLVSGGLISLDGIHLTSRGYALMANEILKAIDTKWGSNFGQATNGLAKADDYPTNYSPALR